MIIGLLDQPMTSAKYMQNLYPNHDVNNQKLLLVMCKHSSQRPLILVKCIVTGPTFLTWLHAM